MDLFQLVDEPSQKSRSNLARALFDSAPFDGSGALQHV